MGAPQAAQHALEGDGLPVLRQRRADLVAAVHVLLQPHKVAGGAEERGQGRDPQTSTDCVFFQLLGRGQKQSDMVRRGQAQSDAV